MRENGGSYGNLDRGKMNHVVKEDRSLIRGTRSGDNVKVNAAQEGCYVNGTNLEVEYPAYSSENQQVGKELASIVESDHRRVRSASDAHDFFLFEDGTATSKSCERDEYTKEKGKPMTQRKDIGRPHEQFQQPCFDEHSEPGCSESHETVDLISKLDREMLPKARRSLSMDSVSSWLRDASIGESLQGFENQYDTTDDSQSNEKTPGDPCSYQHISDANDYEKNELAISNQPQSLSPGSIYRGPGDQRPLSNKAFDFVKKGVVGFATVSQKAAVEIAKVSRTTSKQVRNKSIEFKNLAAPVLAPIFQAVIEEGRDQSTGHPDREHDRVYDQREGPNSAELQRMATPYVQPIGRGRGAPTSPRPMKQQPVHKMRPTMQGGRRLVVRPMDRGPTGALSSAQVPMHVKSSTVQACGGIGEKLGTLVEKC